MSCVSSVTWSTVDRPGRKPACSRGSCGSTTGSMRLCIMLSRILNGTQSSEMGLYDLGSCAGLFGFGSATTVARRQVFGSLDLRKHDVRNKHSQAVCLCALVNDKLWVDVVASRCFTRLQLFEGRFKFLNCKVGRQVGIGGGCSRKRGDFTRRPTCEVSVCIWEASVIQKLRSNSICSHWTPRVRRASACQLVYGLPRLAT